MNIKLDLGGGGQRGSACGLLTGEAEGSKAAGQQGSGAAGQQRGRKGKASLPVGDGLCLSKRRRVSIGPKFGLQMELAKEMGSMCRRECSSAGVSRIGPQELDDCL